MLLCITIWFVQNKSMLDSHAVLCFQMSIAAKVSVSLLRYTELIHVDKAFYEAGQACKVGPPGNITKFHF